MPLWGNTDAANKKPAYLSTADKQNAVFIDRTEASIEANRAKGITNPGWWLISPSYTDAQGNTRQRVECLVALDQIAAVAGDNDTIASTVTLSIGSFVSNPTNATVTAGSNIVFTVVPVANTKNFSIEWQVSTDDGSTWTAIAGESKTKMTVMPSDVSANGYKYRVKLWTSLDSGVTATSSAIAITVNA